MIKTEKKKLIFVIICTVILTLLAAGAGFLAFCKISGMVFVNSGTYRRDAAIAEKYSKLYTIQKKINTNGYYKVSETKQMNAMYKALVKSVGDKYSVYFTAKEAKEWDNYVNGTFYGIGIVFSEDEDGNYVINDVMDESPAKSAGLKKNDIIRKVDGKTFPSTTELKKAITGKQGTRVKVTYERGGAEKTVSIIRGEVREITVKGTMLKGKIGYIRISSFAEKTAEEFKTELKALEKKNPKGVIIDIRANGGGYANQGIEIADMLLPEGTITYVKDRNGKKTYFNSDESCTRLKYVLLVDGNTASTSELLAAAVEYNSGGKLVGATTFGKGIMQAEYPFRDGSALKLTTHQYFSPKGHRINGKGVRPDYVVKLKSSDTTDRQLQKAMDLLK